MSQLLRRLIIRALTNALHGWEMHRRQIPEDRMMELVAEQEGPSAVSLICYEVDYQKKITQTWALI